MILFLIFRLRSGCGQAGLVRLSCRGWAGCTRSNLVKPLCKLLRPSIVFTWSSIIFDVSIISVDIFNLVYSQEHGSSPQQFPEAVLRWRNCALGGLDACVSSPSRNQIIVVFFRVCLMGFQTNPGRTASLAKGLTL